MLGGRGQVADAATAPIPGPRGPAVARAARELEAWGWERRWRGRDPYDALNGSRARKLGRTPLARRVVIQLAKRSPVDLSGPLGVPRGENANAIAHVLGAYARMDPGLGIEEAAARAEWAIDRLEELRCSAYEEPCWSYHFDVETRFFFYSAETPNTIATSFAAHALIDAHERLASDRALALAEGAGDFFLRRIARTDDPDGSGAFLGYFPGDRTPIHNASMLAASALARLAALTGRADFAEAAAGAVRYALDHQREDGSWPYAEGDVGGWVDNFHTGYVLDALLRCARALGDEEALAAWRSGLRYFRERLVDPDGAPRFTDRSRHPIDGQCVAQSIETLVLGSELHPELLADARRVLDFGVERMRRRDGAFVFQRHARLVNRAAHVRWVQAPMLAALVDLDAAERGAAAREGEAMRVWIDLANSPHPLLFGPISERLERLGAEVDVTYRDHAQTEELTLERWPGASRIGDPSPPGLLAKARAIGGRVVALREWASRRRPDVALSHNSYAQALAARSLRTPAVTAMDYEHQPANHVAFRCAQRILLPEAVPEAAVRRQGASPAKVVRYRGLKEEVYLADFEPDEGILERLGVERPPGGAVVVARSAPAGAAYHPGENPILDDCLRALSAREDVVTVALARHGWQREALRALGLPRLVVPDGAVDARSLLHAADAFVGAGGTMSREAALLGLDTWSAFAGRRPAVDEWLESEGRLHALSGPDQLASIGPRQGVGADLARLASEGERIRDAFVDAVHAAAGREPVSHSQEVLR